MTFLKEMLSAFSDMLCKYKEERPSIGNVELIKYFNCCGKIKNNASKNLDNDICVMIREVTCNESYTSGNVAIHSFYSANREPKTFLRNIFKSLDELYSALNIEQI